MASPVAQIQRYAVGKSEAAIGQNPAALEIELNDGEFEALR
jgi:hypothetical protein